MDCAGSWSTRAPIPTKRSHLNCPRAADQGPVSHGELGFFVCKSFALSVLLQPLCDVAADHAAEDRRHPEQPERGERHRAPRKSPSRSSAGLTDAFETGMAARWMNISVSPMAIKARRRLLRRHANDDDEEQCRQDDFDQRDLHQREMAGTAVDVEMATKSFHFAGGARGGAPDRMT